MIHAIGDCVRYILFRMCSEYCRLLSVFVNDPNIRKVSGFLVKVKAIANNEL